MNAFAWQDGTPSIFATPAALRYAKTLETSRLSGTTQAAKRPRVEPQKAARPRQYVIDMHVLRTLIAAGKTQKVCALHFGCSVKTIENRLRNRKKGLS